MSKPIYIHKRDAGAPKTSWWADAPRDHFSERVAQEAPRMCQSRFGRWDETSATCNEASKWSEVPKDARQKLRRAKEPRRDTWQ